MMDLTSSLAPYMYEAMEGVRNIEADRRLWNTRLRQIRTAERIRAERGVRSGRPVKAQGGVKVGR